MMTQDETQDETRNGPQYVTVEDAAEMLRDELEANGWRGGANTIKSWVTRKSLTAYRQGRRQVINLDELRRYIRTHGRQGEIRPWE